MTIKIGDDKLERNKNIINMYIKEDKSTQFIADLIGLSRAGISKILKNNDIKLKSRGAKFGKILSQETKNKIGLANKNKIHTDEFKNRMSKIKRHGKNPKEYMLGDRLAFKKNSKNIYVHRYIWEKHYGKIPKGFVIHHKDKNPLNNNINNLQLLTRSEHAKLHYNENDFSIGIIGKEPWNKGLNMRCF